MGAETDQPALDAVGGTTAVNTGVNTPMNLEKEKETVADTPSHTSGDDLDLAEKQNPEETTRPNVEYPVGFRLFAIVIALILSIFLVALDMTVRDPEVSTNMKIY